MGSDFGVDSGHRSSQSKSQDSVVRESEGKETRGGRRVGDCWGHSKPGQ